MYGVVVYRQPKMYTFTYVNNFRALRNIVLRPIKLMILTHIIMYLSDLGFI